MTEKYKWAWRVFWTLYAILVAILLYNGVSFCKGPSDVNCDKKVDMQDVSIVISHVE